MGRNSKAVATVCTDVTTTFRFTEQTPNIRKRSTTISPKYEYMKNSAIQHSQRVQDIAPVEKQ